MLFWYGGTPLFGTSWSGVLEWVAVGVAPPADGLWGAAVQVLQAVLKNKDDPTRLALLYCNQTESDILLREEMEALAAAHPDRFQIWYTLDRSEPGWAYSTGHINEAMMRDHLFPGDADTIACMCGPPGMIKFACIPNLEKLGYATDHYFAF